MIPLCWQRPADRRRVEARATRLGCPSQPLEQLPAGRLCLLYAADGWCLNLDGLRWRPDWLEPVRLHRYRQATVRREALARACGLKGGLRPDVCDATAGLAQDACVLAVLGCQLRLLEAHPIVFLLLQQAWQAACEHPLYGANFTRMTLECVDSVHWLQQAEPQPVICIDPMFARGDLRGQVSKPMQLLRELQRQWPVPAGDATILLQVALERAERRVVVKRARRAEPLAGRQPHHSIDAGHCRFDVYVKN